MTIWHLEYCVNLVGKQWIPMINICGSFDEAAREARRLNKEPDLYGAVTISGPHQHAVPK